MQIRGEWVELDGWMDRGGIGSDGMCGWGGDESLETAEENCLGQGRNVMDSTQ